MGVKRVEDLDAFELAHAFKLRVYDIVERHPKASNDLRYRSQLFEAASGGESNIDEGFSRYGAADFSRFLTYARSSLAEARRRLRDGVHRKYFPSSEVTDALILGARALGAVAALQRSLEPFIRQRRSSRPRPPKPRNAKGEESEGQL